MYALLEVATVNMRAEDLPERYWHCLVKQRGEYALIGEMTREQLFAQVLDPMYARRPFSVEGAVVHDVYELDKIQITCNPYPNAHYAAPAGRVSATQYRLRPVNHRMAGLQKGEDWTQKLVWDVMAERPSAKDRGSPDIDGGSLVTNFFISYTASDKEWAEWIAYVLEDEGFSTRIQAWDFRPGSNFVSEMQTASMAAERTLLVLSDDYLKSPMAASEWNAAFVNDPQGKGRKLLPVMVRECKPDGLLSSIVQIRIHDLPRAKARETLLAGISTSRAKPALMPNFPGEMSAHKDFPGVVLPAGSPSVQSYETAAETLMNREIHGAASGQVPGVEDAVTLRVAIVPFQHFDRSLDPFTGRREWRIIAFPHWHGENLTFQGCLGGMESGWADEDEVPTSRFFVGDDWLVHSYVRHPFAAHEHDGSSIPEFPNKFAEHMGFINGFFEEQGVDGPFGVWCRVDGLHHNPRMKRFFRGRQSLAMPRPLLVHEVNDSAIVDGFPRLVLSAAG